MKALNTNVLHKTIAAIVFLAAGAAVAAEDKTPPGHGKAQFIKTYDTNKDSAVTTEEFVAARAANYARTDSDKNGTVNEAEYVGEFEARLTEPDAAARAAQLKQAHVRFGVLDSDKNGVLTLEEFQATGQSVFGRLDTNKDGRVDSADGAEGY
jgi:Ca2+-binding EF-hand superfamily protein